jgi:hypothetical protein
LNLALGARATVDGALNRSKCWTGKTLYWQEEVWMVSKIEDFRPELEALLFRNIEEP